MDDNSTDGERCDEMDDVSLEGVEVAADRVPNSETAATSDTGDTSDGRKRRHTSGNASPSQSHSQHSSVADGSSAAVNFSSSSSSSSSDPAMSPMHDSDTGSPDESIDVPFKQDDLSVPDHTPCENCFNPLKWLGRRELGQTALQRDLQSDSSMLRQWRRLHLLEKHEGCVNSLGFDRSGTLLASGSDDLDICLWNVHSGELSAVWRSGHESNIFQTKFLTSSQVVSGARDGRVILAELTPTGLYQQHRLLARHKGAAHKLAMFRDSANEFLSCSEDSTVLHIDVRQPKANKLLNTRQARNPEHVKPGQRADPARVVLYSIDASPTNSNMFMTTGRDQFVRLYDRRKITPIVDLTTKADEPLQRLCPEKYAGVQDAPNVTCGVFSYDGSELVASYNDEDIYIFNVANDPSVPEHTYRGHRNNATVKGVNFYGGRSEYVVSGSDDGHIYVWSKKTEKVLHWIEADVGGVVNVLEPHPTLPVLATSGLDASVKIWSPVCTKDGADYPFDRSELYAAARENYKQRERDNNLHNVDSNQFFFIMRQLQRRRQQMDAGDSDVEDEANSLSGEEDNDSVRCAQQ